MNKKNFIQNALTSALISILLNGIGMCFKVYLSNQIGSEGMGLQQLILSVYFPATTLAASGINLASTRMTSEALARGTPSVQSILHKCFGYSAFFGLLSASLLFFGADTIAAYWLKEPAAALPLKILSVGLPFLSTASALQGFFVALRKSSISSFLQAAEDLSKIGATILLFQTFLKQGMEAACCAMMAGMALGEILSCLCGFGLYLKQKKKLRQSEDRPKGIFRTVCRISLPCAFSAYLRSAISLFENVKIPDGLKKSGLSQEQTLAALGRLNGMVMPLMMFPATLLNSFSRLLVPELTDALALNNRKRIHRIIEEALRPTFLFAVFVSGLLLLSGDMLGTLFYQDSRCGELLRLLAPLVPLMYADSVVDAMLKGLNEQLASMQFNIIDSLSRTLLVCFLLPSVGFYGYIAILYFSRILNFSLSITRLIRVTGFRFSVTRLVLLPLTATAAALLPLEILSRLTTFPDWLGMLLSIPLYIFFLWMLDVPEIRKTIQQLKKRPKFSYSTRITTVLYLPRQLPPASDPTPDKTGRCSKSHQTESQHATPR